MNPKYIERPDYLMGTFDWRGLGYSFGSEPPRDLLSQSAKSDEPWNCIGQFIARCRSGEVPNTGILQDIVKKDNINEPLLLQACYDLLGDVAGKNEIDFFDHLIRNGSKNQKMSASWAGQWTASIELLPAMLCAFKSIKRTEDKQAITAIISNILEGESGDDDLELYDYEGNDESYAELVMQRADDLARQWPGCERFYAGMPLDTYALITRFREVVSDMVDRDKVPQESLILLRRWFESSTGTDCSSMFLNQRFNPQASVDLLDDWFDSNTIEYIKGGKYFFNFQCSNV